METLEQMIRNRSRFRLPEPLDGDTHFTWGPVVQLHKLPALDTIIIEYKPEIFENGFATKKYSDEHNFHLHGTSGSFDRLEAAIIFAIARHNNVCDDFARAACHLMCVEKRKKNKD